MVRQTDLHQEIQIMAFFISVSRRSKLPLGQRWRKSRLHLEPLEDRSLLSGYQQHNLVGFQPGYMMAHYTDPKLNGWGLAFAPDGPFWVADTATGVSTLYDHQGKPQPLIVTIPPAPGQPPGTLGTPTGIVYNPTSDFVITKGGKSAPALFLFDTIDGTISGWNPAVDPTNAVIMVNNSSAGAHYWDLLIAQNSKGQNVLYAANGDPSGHGTSEIDMFDGSSHPLGSPFTDHTAVMSPTPVAYAVKDVAGRLFVTYIAFTATPDVTYGGVVDEFDTDGHLIKTFTANAPGMGPLANPWGVVQAPADFGEFSDDILIGNVEQNKNNRAAASINAFDPSTGAFLGHLQQADGTPIAIPGLWDLDFGAGSPQNGTTKELFFTAGPNAVNFAGNGLFGYIHAAGDQGGGAAALPGGSGGLGLLDDSMALSMESAVFSDPKGATGSRAGAMAGSENTPAGRMAHDFILPGSDLADFSAAPETRAFLVSPQHRSVQTSASGQVDSFFVELMESLHWGD
jgi:uncharacterized protein (TIGR03118 family)